MISRRAHALLSALLLLATALSAAEVRPAGADESQPVIIHLSPPSWPLPSATSPPHASKPPSSKSPAPKSPASAPAPTAPSTVTSSPSSVAEAPSAPAAPADTIAPAREQNTRLDTAPVTTDASAPADTPPTVETPQVIAPPTASTGAPETKETVPGAPVAQGQVDPTGNFVLESPDGVIYDAERGLAVASGPVTFTYREFQVRGDRGVVDYNTNRATISGNLTVTVQGRVLTGQSLIFDLQTGQWTLSQVATTFEPSFFLPGTVLEPIYVFGAKVQGQGDQLTGSDFTISSCDRGHYYFEAKRLDFYRDQNGQPSKIVLRHPSLYLFHRKILPLPTYVISLTGARSRRVGLQPVAGENDVDGFFVKNVYDLRATSRYTDSLLFDLLQKRGLGLGLVREFAGAAGIFSLYAVTGRGDQGRQLDANVQRMFKVGPNIQGNLNFQEADNNSTTGFGNSNRNGNLAFIRTTPRTQSNLLLNMTQSSGGGFSTNNDNFTLQHRQQFGNGFSLDTNSQFSMTSSTGVPDTEQLGNRAQLNYNNKSFDALGRLELFNDLTNQSGSSIYQLSRLPEFVLSSNTDRLRLPGLAQLLPGDFALGLGEFSEPRFGIGTEGRDLTTRSRANMLYNARPREVPLVGGGTTQSSLTLLGRFEQAFYSDSSAKYDYTYGATLNNRLGPFSTQINYLKVNQRGFTPFAFDFFTPAETIDATVAFQPSSKLRANLSLGRDLQNGISYDVVGRLQLQPSRNFYASLGTNYSPTTSQFGDIIGNFHIARRPVFLGGALDLGVRYSTQQNMLSQANAQTTFTLSRKTKIEALASYNGFTGQFDSFQFRVTQDLHCFNLYATYDNFNHQFRLDLALKAFPFFDTRYGVGAAGQGFSPVIGSSQ